MNTQNAQPVKKHIAEWPWAAIVLVVGWMGFWILYSSGDAYYRAFLSHFSVEADGFPIDQYRHFVLSELGGLNFITLVGNFLHKNRFMVFVFLVAYVVLMVCAIVFNFVKGGKGKVKRNISGRPISRAIGEVVLIWYVIPVGLIMASGSLVVCASLPSAFAEAAGNAVADASDKDYQKGCEKSEERCQIALKGGVEIARGYVIAQSLNRIALFNNGATVQIPLEGVELRTVPKSLKP